MRRTIFNGFPVWSGGGVRRPGLDVTAGLGSDAWGRTRAPTLGTGDARYKLGQPDVWRSRKAELARFVRGFAHHPPLVGVRFLEILDELVDHSAQAGLV